MDNLIVVLLYTLIYLTYKLNINENYLTIYCYNFGTLALAVHKKFKIDILSFQTD